jgi:hypothetical protein
MILEMNRELANVQAILDVDNRCLPNTGKFYDLMDGTNNYSNGLLDTSATTLSSAPSVGASSLSVVTSSVFTVGEKVTVYDDAGQEDVTIQTVTPETIINQGATKTLTPIGSAVISTAQSKIGTASGLFNGTSSSVYTPKSTDFDFGTGDFTIEMYLYCTSLTIQGGYSRRIVEYVASPSTGAVSGEYHLYIDQATGKLAFESNTTVVLDTTAFPTNAWTHIAIVRSGTTTKMYVGGTVKATATDTYNYSSSTAYMYLGSANNIGGFYSGYIDELRISKGIARYTSNFTPPTVALVTDAFTKLLLHFEGANNSTVFVDSEEFVVSGVMTLVSPTVNAYKVTGKVARSNVIISGGKMKCGNITSVGPQDKSAGVIVSTGTPVISSNAQRYLVRDIYGYLYTVMEKTVSTFTQIFCLKSTDNGATWTDLGFPQVASYNQHNPSIATDSLGNVYVVWNGMDSVDTAFYNIKYAKYSSGAWSAITKLTSGSTLGQQQTPAIMADSLNNIHVTWTGGDTIDPGKFNVRYIKYNGTSWGTPVKITSGNSYDQINPSIAIDTTNNIHIVWSGMDATEATYSNIRYSKSADNGATFSAQAKITTGIAGQSLTPCIIADSTNALHVAFSGWDGTDVAYNIKYIKYSGSWGAITKLTSGATYAQSAPSITVDSSNNVYIVWYGTHGASTSINQIRKIVYAGSWGSVINVTSAASDQTLPSTCANYQVFTDPLLVWKDNVNSSIDFRGIFTGNILSPLLVSKARYNITSRSGIATELAAWVTHEKDAGFNTSANVSIVDTLANESFASATKTTYNIDSSSEEDAYYASVGTAQERITFELVLTRSSGAIDKGVLKVLGAVD